MKHITTSIGTITFCIAMLCVLSCQKNYLKPEPKTVVLEDATSGQGVFIIKSDNITETEHGLHFYGTLSTKTDKGEEFEVGEGEFDVVTGPGGAVNSITGVGIPEFPNVGLFAEMLKTYSWAAVKSFIDYEEGQYYIDRYNTDVPLDPQRKYLHFKVFDQNMGGKFELGLKLDRIRYNFLDCYIDPLDPSIYMKAEIAFPSAPFSGDEPSNDEAWIYWQTVEQTLNETFIDDLLPQVIGKGADKLIGIQAIVGISNQAKLLTKSYEMKPFDRDYFLSKYRYLGFPALPSHFFLRLAEVPIPYTRGLLQGTGDFYIHLPRKSLFPLPGEVNVDNNSYDEILDFFNDKKDYGYMKSFTGSIDPLANPVVDGIFSSLPQINRIFGKEVFNEDVDLDLAGATYQSQMPGPKFLLLGSEPAPDFEFFGGQLKTPKLVDFFGPGIRKYLTQTNTPGISAIFCLTVGPGKNDFSIYTEGGVQITIPYFGEQDFGMCTYYVDSTGIELSRSMLIELGPIRMDQGLKGKIGPEGFSLSGKIDHSINVANIELKPVQITLNVNNTQGAVFSGEVNLPLGLGNAQINGKLTREEISLSGSLKAGTEIDLGNGFKLPTAEMKFTASDSKGFLLEGEVQVPDVGWVTVKGKINSDDFLLEGSVAAGGITFGTTLLNHINAGITISKKNGVYFSGHFDLAPFGMRELTGPINATQISLTGNFNATVPIGGHSFSFGNATVTANNSGVNMAGIIDLYFSKVKVAGDYHGSDDFTLKGQHSYSTAVLKASMNVTVTPIRVIITSTGKVYGVLGNELYSGALSIVPDWTNKAVSACYTIAGKDFCIKL